MKKTAVSKKPFLHKLYPGISTRVTAPFLIIVIFIAGLGIFTVTRLVAGSIQERLDNQLADSAQAAHNVIVEIERQQLATLRLMVFTEGVAEAVTARDAEALDLLLRPIAANANLGEAIVFDQNGHSIYQLTSLDSNDGGDYISSVPPRVDDWPGVLQVLTAGTDALGDKFVDIIERDFGTVFYTSAPVVDPNSQAVVGGVSVGVSALDFTRWISDQALADVVLYNADGTVIGSTFRLVPDETFRLSPQRADEITIAIQSDMHLMTERSIDGTPYKFFYTAFEMRSRQVGLMAVALSSNFVAERIGLSRDSFALLFSLLFVGVWLLGLVIARSIIGPVRRLVDTTRAIREGDLSKRVDLSTPDELGELGLSFDHMTAELIKRNESINALYSHQVQETARRAAILTSISDAVVVLDSDGRTLLLNQTARSLIDALDADSPERDELIRLCQSAPSLYEPRTINLNNRFYNALARPVNMPSGELLGYVVVLRDITAVLEAERIKDEMILQLSHELRTPLTAVRGYTELALRLEPEGSDGQRGRFIKNALDQLGTLTRMIDQVIDVSQAITGNLALDSHEFDLKELITDVVEAQYPFIEAQQLNLKLSANGIGRNEKLIVEGDPMRIASVLEHVLRNAYSYTLPGGRIEIRLSTQGPKAVIKVEDSGVGIAQDEIDRVFDRLYRGRSAEAGPTDTRGLGLGLYLSKEIIDAHGGAIHLESTVDVGTAVTIELPKSPRG